MRVNELPSTSGCGLGSRPSLPFRSAARRGPNANVSRSCTRVLATAAPEVDAVSEEKRDIQQMLNKPYKFGFKTIIESDVFPKGLDEDVVRAISAKKEEPEWMLEFRSGAPLPSGIAPVLPLHCCHVALLVDNMYIILQERCLLPHFLPAWKLLAALMMKGTEAYPFFPSRRCHCRLKAFRRWLTMEEPSWSDNTYPTIDYQGFSYYSAPKMKEKKASLDEVDPELLATFDKLGIPLGEQKRLANVAVDAVFDSVSIATTFKEELGKAGVIFCSISEAVREHPDLVKKYLGSVVPASDNYFSALNAAVFSDGSFVYVPKGVRSPMELSTYFRINASETGQFERTLIVCEEGAYVSYLEGCTAPAYDNNQLHAAVVELSAATDAEIKYSTVQNWYAGDADGRGGIYNFVTKRGMCVGDRSKISWTQVETGSAITWKYPSVVLKGDGSVGEFYSVALTNNMQQADTGTKMVHVGKNTRSRIVSKGISAGKSRNAYRGLVQVQPSAEGARNYSQCDSMLIGDTAGANTYPYIQVRHPSARVEHEASTSKIGEDQLFYFQQRGVGLEDAVGMIISGFCREVFNELPLEFAAEVNQLMSLKLEGSVG
jgi:Fe-S cluster assembly protein SufB